MALPNIFRNLNFINGYKLSYILFKIYFILDNMVYSSYNRVAKTILVLSIYLAVAQLGSALEWGSRGRRFDSCQPDHNIRSI